LPAQDTFLLKLTFTRSAAAPTFHMTFLPLRLPPGSDLRRAVEQVSTETCTASGFVVTGIGSLSEGRLRFAGAQVESVVAGPLEMLSVSGSITPDGAHLHMTVADHSGRVYGGHVCYGNTVLTTVELLVAPVADWELSRAVDEATNYRELVIRRAGEV
jgi:predicted DNA-binding protein with PD1-like motif